MTTTTTYYRVFDHQRGDYFATGYNATSKEELISDFQSYLALSVDDQEDEDVIHNQTWEQIADHLQDVSLEESNELFEEIDL